MLEEREDYMYFGLILPGAWHSTTQRSFQEESNGHPSAPGVKMSRRVMIIPAFQTCILEFFLHTVYGINTLHRTEVLLLHYYFQTITADASILPWGCMSYSSSFWATSIMTWIDEIPEEAEARSPTTLVLGTNLLLMHSTFLRNSTNHR